MNQTARVDLTLEIGAITDEVTVEASSAVLQTESPTVGQVISGNTTVGLPLNGRNFQQLTLLVAGAITPNPGGFTGPGIQGGQGRPFVNGNREQGNAFLLDGISVDETIDNRIGYKPNIDAIAEFKIETSNSSAEFGNVTGATVNATLKSGTNQLRGNVFEFFRERRARRQLLVEQPQQRAQAEARTEHLRRHDRRPHRQEQDLLLRRLPGHPPGDRRRHHGDRRAARMAPGRSVEPHDGDHRPDDRSAVSRQPHPDRTGS